MFPLLQKDLKKFYHESMPRKTLALFIFLVLVTIVLVVISIQTGQNQMQPTKGGTKTMATPTPDVAHTVLSMSPATVQVASGKVGSVDVMIDTSDNDVTAVQLELLYDPTMISNVKVVSGPLFPNANVLIDKNSPETGKYTYAYGILPNKTPVKGKGVVAKITFVARGVPGKQSQIIMDPSSLVTARAVAGTVLKSGTGATVVISAPQGATTKKVVVPVTSKAPTQ